MIIASLSQGRSSLALGNAIGSSISNILGAFSLGLLFQTSIPTFDTSSKIYTSILLFCTSAITTLALTNLLGKAVGGILIATFGVYLVSIGWGIYKGRLTPAELSDSDDDGSDEESDVSSTDVESSPSGSREHEQRGTEASPLLSDSATKRFNKPSHNRRSLVFHISQVIMGFFALCISGYILSVSASTLADALHLSGTVVGLTILSFATTLPEKFVAVFSGSRGHVGILVANTVGSNIFLLTLCLGIVLVSTGGVFDSDINKFELLSMWASSVVLFLIVFLGSRRWAGILLLFMYLVFLVLEFTLYRR